MRSVSRKTAAWVSGAVIAVGGATAGIVAATSSGGSGGNAAHAADAAKHAAAKPVALRLVSISPQGGATAANGATGVTVTYNKPLPATAPFPTLAPAIAGSWARQGDTVVFTPASGYPSGTKVTVTAADGTGTTASTTTSTFKTGKYSTLRLQEILAQLGYLPLTWTPDLRIGGARRQPAGAAGGGLRPAGRHLHAGSPGTRPRCTNCGSRAAPTPWRPARSPRSRATTSWRRPR